MQVINILVNLRAKTDNYQGFEIIHMLSNTATKNI